MLFKKICAKKSHVLQYCYLYKLRFGFDWTFVCSATCFITSLLPMSAEGCYIQWMVMTLEHY